MKLYFYILLLFIPRWAFSDPITNLYLEIPAVTNGVVPVVLHNIEPGKVYQLLSTPTLPPLWKWETDLAASSNEVSAETLLKAEGSRFFWATGSDFTSSFVTNGLMEWNKFNDGTGSIAADSSGNGNSVPLIGSPAWGPDILTLDGNTQYGLASSNQLLSLDQHDLTICAWINKSAPSFKGIVTKEFVQAGVGYGGWGFRVQADNHLNWWVQNGQDFVDIGTGTITLGEWTFVAVAWHYASQKADFYLNGVLSSTVGNGAANQHPSGPANLEIGNLTQDESGGNYAFDGSLRDVAIYQRVLSAAEIGQNYLGSELVTNVPLPELLYYQFAEHDQTVPPVPAADSSLLGTANGTIFASFPTSLQWETSVPGIPGTALHFNGVSTHIDTSNSVLFNFTTNLFTINFWIRPLTADGSLAQNGFPGTNGWSVNIGGAYQVVFSMEAPGNSQTISTGPGAANVGLFTMVTIVRTSTTNIAIYINGNSVPVTGQVISPAASTNSLVFGVDRLGQHTLDGDLALPQIWNEALPPTAIANLYLIQSSGKPWP